jgi:hypothetical protein
MITVTTKTAYFISDSKLSGDVIIMNENGEVRVSGLDLLDFVANKVRTLKMTMIILLKKQNTTETK